MYEEGTKVYLYNFHEKDFVRKDVTNYLDEKSVDIQDWFYSTPNTIFIRTKFSAKELSDFLEEKFGIHKHFIVKVEDDYRGRLPKDHWEHFN